MDAGQDLLSGKGARTSAVSARHSEIPIDARHNIRLPSDHEYETVQVYLPQEAPSGEGEKSRVGSVIKGIWTKQHCHVTDSPTEVWIYNKGNEPPGLAGSRHVHAVWGYKPGADPENCLISEMWFYTPGEEFPSYFTPRGVWTLPLIKRDISSMKPHETGFVNVGKKDVKKRESDVTGTWKVLYQKDGLDGGDGQMKSPGGGTGTRGSGMKSPTSSTGSKKPKVMQISARFPDGKKIPLMVKLDSTMDDVKQKIYEKTNKKLLPQQQNLYYKNKKLDTNLQSTLQDHSIKNGYVIDVIPNMILYIHKVSDDSIITLDTNVRSNSTIKSIQKQIATKEKIPLSDVTNLVFSGIVLDDKGNDTLMEHAIKDGDTLELGNEDDGMTIKVVSPDGGTTTNVSISGLTPDSTIGDIKQRVKDKTGIQPNDQYLYYDGNELDDDDDTMDEIGIQHNDTLELHDFTIKVKTPDGKVITLDKNNDDVKPTDTVKDIKKKIHNKLGIPVKEQYLYYKGDELDNDKDTLQSIGIKNNDIIDLTGMTVKVKTPDGKVLPLTNVKPTDTVKDIKKKVHEKIGMPIKEQHLYHKGDELDDDNDTVKNIGIKNNDVIDLTGMKINIKTPDGKVIPIDVRPTDTVNSIKKKVAKNTGIPVDDQELIYNGNELDNDDTLADAGINHGDTIDVEEGMKIKVKAVNGKLFDVKVKPTETIKQLKKKIKATEGTPIKEQRLLLDGVELKDDNETLQHVGIKNGDTVEMGGMQLRVKTPNGKIVPLDVSPTDTSNDVKDKIASMGIMPVDQQHLFFKGKEVPDGRALKDLNLQHNDLLDLEGMKVNVRTPDGTTFPIATSPSDTIDDLKRKIMDEAGHPVAEQTLAYKGNVLEDPADTLEDVGIVHNDTIDLSTGIKVNIRTPDGKVFPIDTSPKETIDDLKRKIKAKAGYPMIDQRLAYKGEELDDPDDTLDDCGIGNNDTIDLSTDIEIKVKMPDGKLVPIVVSGDDKILDVKKAVQEKEGVPVDQQRIMDPDDDTEELIDKKTLRNCGIKHGDILTLGPMQVNVKLQDERVLTLDVDPNDTVKHVKSLIQKKEGIPVENQILSFRGNDLEDDNILSDEGIKHGSTLDLEGMQIFVDSALDGKQIPVDVLPNDTILDVKKRLADKLGIPMKDQRLLKDEKELDNDATLSSLGIKNRDRIDLGGMQIIVSCPGGRYLPFEVKATDTMQEIKQRVENNVFIPVGLQRLLFNGVLLDDNSSTLLDNNIKNGALLDLKGINLHVRIPQRDNKKITLEVIPLWYIKDVKLEIIEKFEKDLELDLLKLKRGDRELTNKPNLKYYGIVHDDEIELEILPTYNVEMSSWQSPFEMKAKKKITREGVRAKARPSLKNLMDT